MFFPHLRSHRTKGTFIIEKKKYIFCCIRSPIRHGRNQSHGQPLNIFNIASKKTNNQQIEQNETKKKQYVEENAAAFSLTASQSLLFTEQFSVLIVRFVRPRPKHFTAIQYGQTHKRAAFASQFTHNALRHTLTPLDKVVRYATWKFYVLPFFSFCVLVVENKYFFSVGRSFTAKKSQMNLRRRNIMLLKWVKVRVSLAYCSTSKTEHIIINTNDE